MSLLEYALITQLQHWHRLKTILENTEHVSKVCVCVCVWLLEFKAASRNLVHLAFGNPRLRHKASYSL